MKAMLNRLHAMKPRELDRLREAVDVELERRSQERDAAVSGQPPAGRQPDAGARSLSPKSGRAA
jgi:hypothetical protein